MVKGQQEYRPVTEQYSNKPFKVCPEQIMFLKPIQIPKDIR